MFENIRPFLHYINTNMVLTFKNVVALNREMVGVCWECALLDVIPGYGMVL